VTVPVANDGVTVAVNVSGEPYVDGLPDEVSVTVTLALFTVSASADEELLLSFASPL
jgi:hypothetical protein